MGAFLFKKLYRTHSITNFTRDKNAFLLLILLLSADIFLILLNSLWSLYSHSPILIVVSADGSYPEFYQYLKEFWIVCLILSIYKQNKEIGYLAWAVLFFYMLLDDCLEIHEKFGGIIEEYFGLNSIPIDIGELSATAFIALFIFSFLGISYYYGKDIFKRVSREILVFILLIVFFGVFVDTVHSALHLSRALDFLASIIEDGGEMIAMSITASYFFYLKLNYFSAVK